MIIDQLRNASPSRGKRRSNLSDSDGVAGPSAARSRSTGRPSHGQRRRNQSGVPWLVDHVGCGGIQQLPVRASRMAARGWWPWLRAVVRQERIRQWRLRVARVRQARPYTDASRRRAP